LVIASYAAINLAMNLSVVFTYVCVQVDKTSSWRKCEGCKL